MTKLPPFNAICSILRARLRKEPLPADFGEALSSSSEDDTAWVRTTSRHRIGPALGACLQDFDLEGCLPADLRLYFQILRNSNKHQNMCFLDEMVEVIQAMNELGVEPCLLKGAGTLVDGLFPSPSWRFMNDLDLLVSKEHLEACWNKLRALGYLPYNEMIGDKEHHHRAPLYHPEKSAHVELHHDISRPRYSRILPVRELLERSCLLDKSPFGRIYLPHPDDRAVLLVAHAQVFNGYHQYGMFRLTDLVEMDRLATRYPLNFKAIMLRFQACGWAHEYLAFLGLSDMLLSSPGASDHPMTAYANLASRRFIWLQNRRSMALLNLTAGWFVQALRHTLQDGDWRHVHRRTAQSLAGNAPGPFYGLKQTIREYS